MNSREKSLPVLFRLGFDLQIDQVMNGNIVLLIVTYVLGLPSLKWKLKSAILFENSFFLFLVIDMLKSFNNSH